MTDENKKMLVTLLARYKIPLLENDIFGDIHFSAKRPMPAKAFDKDGCSFVFLSPKPCPRVFGSVGPHRDIYSLQESVTATSSA